MRRVGVASGVMQIRSFILALVLPLVVVELVARHPGLAADAAQLVRLGIAAVS